MNGECKGTWGNQDCTEWQQGAHRPTIQLTAACKEDMSVKCRQKVIAETWLLARLCWRLHEQRRRTSICNYHRCFLIHFICCYFSIHLIDAKEHNVFSCHGWLVGWTFLSASKITQEVVDRDVRNGFFKFGFCFGSVLRKTAVSVWKNCRFGSIFFVDQL